MDEAPSSEIETVETNLGTATVETPERVYNPITDEYRDLRKLSENGYCRRFLATLAAYNTPSVINLDSSPVASFNKEKWELQETDNHIILVKQDAETPLDELLLND